MHLLLSPFSVSFAVSSEKHNENGGESSVGRGAELGIGMRPTLSLIVTTGEMVIKVSPLLGRRPKCIAGGLRGIAYKLSAESL